MKIHEWLGEYPRLSLGPGCLANAIMMGAQYSEFLPTPFGVAIATLPALVFIFVRVGSASDEVVTIAHGLGALLYVVVFCASTFGYALTENSDGLVLLVPLGMLGFIPSCYVLWKIGNGTYIESPDEAL